jgi:hypothetical protein
MGPLIMAALWGCSVVASIEYRADSTEAGRPSTGITVKDGFRGSALPDANTSYACWIAILRFQHPKLNLPGEECEGGTGSPLLHSLTEVTSNFGAGDVSCDIAAEMVSETTERNRRSSGILLL